MENNTEHKAQEHTHHHGGGTLSAFLWPAVSLAMLAGGMVMAHFGPAWFAADSRVQLAWYIAAFLPVGLPVLKEGFEAVRGGDIFNEFTLMLIACAGAFFIGEYPEAVGVMLFYCIGEALQHRAVDRATRNISHLLDVRGEEARVKRGDGYVAVKPQDVGVGEIVEVMPGGRVPLDGVLLDDDGVFDTSALTGESVPRNIRRGGEVLAGMIATGTTSHIKVSREYSGSALARILDMVENATSRKAPTEQFIRKFARVYTPVVTLLAVLLVAVPALYGLVVPSFHYVFSDWLYRALVFLVISCPCALVISVPLGYFAGIGAASRTGILFKGGNYLDAVAKLDAVAFDKTGTLTTGNFHVESIDSPDISADRLLALAAAVEQGSTHPIAKAIVAEARRRGIAVESVGNITEKSGLGAEGIVGGSRVMAGSPRMLAKAAIAYPAELDSNPGTIVACAVDGRYAGCIRLSDTLKSDSASAVAQLRGLGIKNVAILSGDRHEIVAGVARRLGVDEAKGELLPEGKARYVEDAAKSHNIAFVGDGLNDAPVLAISSVGIAMGGLGSDAAIESADVVIQTDQPSKVATAIRIGRYTRRIVMQNIVGAITIKVVILALGAAGVASLWAAVFADVGVALLAVANSMRILWHKFS